MIDAGSPGISSTRTSTLNIPNANVENSVGYGLTASEASTINIRNGKMKNSMDYGIYTVASGCATTNSLNNPIIGDCSADSLITLSSSEVLFYLNIKSTVFSLLYI